MSTSSIWSASSTTQSGTVSRCRTPVTSATTSFRLSRCWMLTVVITSMPARQAASTTSSQRLASPGARDVRVRELVDQRHLGIAHAAPRPRPSLRTACRGTRPCAAARARGPGASRSSVAARTSRRTRRRPACRARRGDGPQRASRRSCRRPARHRGRSARARPSPRSPARASIAAAPSARRRPRGRSAPRPIPRLARAPAAPFVPSPRAYAARPVAQAVSSRRGFIICTRPCCLAQHALHDDAGAEGEAR